MSRIINFFNTLSNKKEQFTPINKYKIGMYVCGPTVYDNPHIGNARPLVVFDILFKVLKCKYGNNSVSYVRNITDIDDKIIYLEAKGRFWDYAEYSKYKWVREYLPEDCELVFLFSDPYAPMPQAKKRKDGTKRSHAEWAEKNKFRWFDRDNLPKDWR